MFERYSLERRGDVFDLVHVSITYVSGRRLALREILRANIPKDEVALLKAMDQGGGT